MAADLAHYDLVVFGATGFVGQILCRYLLTQTPPSTPFRWAIAGRSATKLQALVTTLGPDAAPLPPLIADATDADSLNHLCAQTRVVVSTVGPYALYGELLVQACAETGTDYCDLTGESQWMRRMIQRYAAQAQTSGARIVHCCGFDSIPSDLGVYYLQQQSQTRFGEPCTRVKMRVVAAQGGVSGGTAASGLNLVKEATTDASLRESIRDPYSLCPDSGKVTDQLPPLIPVQFDPDFQAWVTPFVMADVNTRVVLRSNFLLQSAYGSTFQYDEGIVTSDGLQGWLLAQALKLGLDSLVLAAALPPTRWLLETLVLPASGTGPTAAEQAQGFYQLQFAGTTAKGEKMRVQVTGDRDPGYGSTAKILGQAALCLAQDIPPSERGGFWTPATLLSEALVKRLEGSSGLTFKVLE
ncbi:MAG: saccharopine dehydrogenase NADP-binding domain-containing protein [Cyanobacteria bacterium P01_D01_bin.115]